jgi:hypothetical protein
MVLKINVRRAEGAARVFVSCWANVVSAGAIRAKLTGRLTLS